MSTERIDTKKVERILEWVNAEHPELFAVTPDWRLVAIELHAALAQERADATALRERIRLLEDGLGLLCDVVNQACQEEYHENGPIISTLALSAYEDAIAYLEKLGLATRMPGKIERWRLHWPESPAAASES